VAQPSRSPQPGEPLILNDGRSFVIERADQDIRGWWFKATLQDGSAMIEGNLRLEWNEALHAWRQMGTRNAALPPSLERRRASRSKLRD
jgi:hypothetical protein